MSDEAKGSDAAPQDADGQRQPNPRSPCPDHESISNASRRQAAVEERRGDQRKPNGRRMDRTGLWDFGRLSIYQELTFHGDVPSRLPKVCPPEMGDRG